MALRGTDLFLINNGATSYQVAADNLFSGAYDNYWALVNEGSTSYKCLVGDLLDKTVTNRIMLVNRGSTSYQVSLQEVQDEYGFTAPPGQIQFTTPGITTWTVPDGVRRISIVAVGGGGAGGAAYWGGGGGGGGALAYRNDYRVRPGDTYQIRVGLGGTGVQANSGGIGGNGQSSEVRPPGFISVIIEAGGGQGGRGTSDGDFFTGAGGKGPWAGGVGGSGTIPATDFVRHNGGRGGIGDQDGGTDRSGGGGAPGGYFGIGAQGQDSNAANNFLPGFTGGAAGGENSPGQFAAQSSGGIGLLGSSNTATTPGGGGSGGGIGSFDTDTRTPYGSGGGGQGTDQKNIPGNSGGHGAIRIIWPGNERQFPSTRTANE